MASLLPLIQDILPMILPASVAVTKAADILPAQTHPAESGPQQEGEASGVRVISRTAIVDKTDKMCGSGKQAHSLPSARPPASSLRHTYSSSTVLIVKSKSSSSVRHHGEQGTFLFFPTYEAKTPRCIQEQ
jgi:hypothetical protein